MVNQKLSTFEFEQLLTGKEYERSIKKVSLELCSGVLGNQWTVIDIIESLKDFLTSTDLSRHNHGLLILGNVVRSLPTDFLNQKEVEFIAEFFCGQLKQHHSFITTTLKGLVSLVKNDHLSRQALHLVTSTLFNNVVWQTQTLSDRMVFYEILQFVVFNHLEDFKSTSSELLFNIISSVDGERDPRNILLIFSFLPKLYTSVPLGSLTEDAFEVASCYFPIDFHSQSSESGSVTREDLVSALNPCLLAHPDFAALCLTLIQEKLESSLKSAKIDSYNLLVEAAEVWPSHVTAPHLEALWQTIKSDVLPPRDFQTAEAASHALQALIRTTKEPHLSSLLSSILSSCDVFLSDIQLSLFEPSFRLLISIMKVNVTVCTFLSQKLLQKFILFLKVSPENLLGTVLDKLSVLIEISLQMNTNFNCEEVWREVVACTDKSPHAYSVLAQGVNHIDLECRLKLYPNIVAHLTFKKTLRSPCVKCLKAMALVYVDEVEEHVFRKLSLLGEKQDLAQVHYEFETVCSLGIVEKFHPAIDSVFTHLVSQGRPYLSLALSGLRNLLETSDSEHNKKLLKFLFSQSSIIPTLFSLQVHGEDLLNSATVVRILTASQEPSDQASCVPLYAEALLQQRNQTRKMVFLEALVGPLWPEVTILTIEEIGTHIIPVALDSFESELSRKSALQLLASAVNKSRDDTILELISQTITNCNDGRKSAVCAYVTKALVLRSHPLMKLWIDKLLELLDSEEDEVAEAAAEGFHLLVQEATVSQSHWVVRLLYRQHLFYIVLPRIVTSAGKLHHLKALAYLLQSVPHTVYMSHIKEILPLLVKSLDLESETLLLTVLTTLSHLMSTNHTLLQDHVDTFIPRFMHLSKLSLFMQVRIAALKCLCSSLKFSPISLLPHKQQVIAELVYCLDDRKRLVRKEAAHTRSKWYLLGAPNPD